MAAIKLVNDFELVLRVLESLPVLLMTKHNGIINLGPRSSTQGGLMVLARNRAQRGRSVQFTLNAQMTELRRYIASSTHRRSPS